MARLELASYDWLNMSDETIEQHLKILAISSMRPMIGCGRWADGLPDDEAP
jgi:hypothetical protein